MYKNILVPLDPGHLDEAEETLKIAEHLKAGDGKITLVSIVEEIPGYVASQIPAEFLDNAEKSAVTNLKLLVQRRNMDADVLVKTGHAAATIKSVQKELDSDLIIISSHKPNNLDYLMGSTASKVVRRAQCPVFVLR
ncbi:MAG: universal stress protein [Rhizobiaceae bacterium]